MLVQAFVYLCAAVLTVPIAKRLGLGSVLGYLIAGVVIGPYALGLVGDRGGDVMHAAEFGVVMMLFMIGLELRPAVLWELRRPILGLGGAQVVVTALAIAAVGVALGFSGRTSIAVGMILSSSSTAIVLQSLSEKGLMKTEGGQAAFSVLLFQDIAVIPMLAIFPLLADPSFVADAAAGGGGHGAHGGADRPGWLQGLLVLGAVGGIVLGGRFVVRPAFRFLAETRLREMFTAAALMLVVGIAVLMELVGLSAALGTFLAGVVLAESEYRHELESDIEPFKGLLLGLFFISVGATIDFGLIVAKPMIIAALVVALVVIKLVVLYALGRIFKIDASGRWLLAFALAQGGEFCFVLFSVTVSAHVLTPEVASPLVAVVALSMLATPLLLIVYDRFVAPRLSAKSKAPERAPDHIHEKDATVVIAGYGRFGQICGRLLRARGITTTVLDIDVALLDTLGRVGVTAYYGDASRVELLHSAGCEKAKLFILAVDEVEKSLEIAHNVRKHFPHLRILARARNRDHFHELRKLGIQQIFRETFASALDTGVAALIALGYRAHHAHRMAHAFRVHDEETLEKLATVYEDKEAYFAAARRARDEMERLLKSDGTDAMGKDEDLAWDPETLREDFGRYV